MQPVKQFLVVALLVMGAFSNPFAQPYWAAQHVGIPSSLMSVLWHNNKFVAVGGSFGLNARAMTSPDGITWTEHDSKGTDRLYEVIWDGSQYVAVGLATSSTALVTTSPDGVNWTVRSSGLSSGMRSVAWNGSMLVVVGSSGSIRTSTNGGSTWTSRSSPVTTTLVRVIWTGTQFVAVGNSGRILTSPNGTSWTAQTSPTTKALQAIAWTGSQFVVVGDSGTILTSPTGVTWTPRTSSNSEMTLYGVAWINDQLVAVGGTSAPAGVGLTTFITTSPDGVNWTTRLQEPGRSMNSVVWDGGKYLVVGALGTAYTSQDNVTAAGVSTNPLGAVASAGGSAQMTTSAAPGGTIPFTYTWVRDQGGVVDTVKPDSIFSTLADTLRLANLSISDTGSYRLIIKNAGGSATSADATLLVNAAPVFSSHPNDTAVAVGAGAAFSAATVHNGSSQGTLSYQWKKNGVNVPSGGTSATYTIASASLADTGLYTVVVTRSLNGTTQSTSNAGRLRVNTPPQLSAQPRDTTVAAGNGTGTAFTVAVTVNNGSSAGTFSYQWKRNGVDVPSGGTSATYTIASATIADTGLYTVEVTRTLEGTTTSTTSAAARLTVNAAPVISTQPRDTAVVAGVAGAFSVSATPVGGGALTYQWKKDGVDVSTGSGGTTETYVTGATSLSDTGSYSVVVASTLNGTTISTTSEAGILRVNAPPGISSQPADTTMAAGATGTAFAVAVSDNGSSSGTLSYKWKKNGIAVPSGGASATYSISSAALSDTGSYTVEVTRTLGGTTTSTESEAGILRVNGAPAISLQPRDTTVVAGVAGTFLVGATSVGGGALSYQWRKNGIDIIGAASASYSTMGATLADTGAYSVVVTSTLNGTTSSTTSGTGMLRVNTAPVITSQPRDTTVAAGSGTGAAFSAAAAVDNGSSAGAFSYQWKKNGVDVPTGGTSATFTIASAAITDTGSYTVVVTRTLNGTTTSTTSSAARLTVNAGPAISAHPGDTTIVAGSVGVFTVSAAPVGGGALSYQWKKNGADVTTGTGGTTATYVTTPTTLADTGSYSVVVTSTLNGTTASSTSQPAVLRVNLAPAISAHPRDTTVAAGGGTGTALTVAVAGNGSSTGTLSYQWRKNGADVPSGGTSATYTIASAAIADTGSYTVVVTRTLNGTTTSTTSSAGRVRVNAGPAIGAQPRDTTVVAGVAGTFSVSATPVGGGTLGYQWKKDGVDIAGATTASYSTAATSLADTGAYSVVVTSTLDGTTTSTTSSAANLRVNTAPVITTQPAATQTIVVGQNATMTVAAAPGAGTSAGTLSYQWRKNGENLVSGGTVGGATSATLTITGLVAGDSGSYTVVITRALNGTTTSVTSNVSLLAAPVAIIMPEAFAIRVNGWETPYAFRIPAGTATEKVTLSIQDLRGRTVWTHAVRPARDKPTDVAWNGRSLNGGLASAGIYIVRISVLNNGVSTDYVRKGVSLKAK